MIKRIICRIRGHWLSTFADGSGFYTDCVYCGKVFPKEEWEAQIVRIR